MYDPSGLYVDPILNKMSIGYSEQNFYGLSLMPETPVRTQSGRYRVFGRENWLIVEDRREPGAVANEIVGGKWSSDNFLTHEHSLQSPVLDEENQQLNSIGGLANAFAGGDIDLDPEADATLLTQRSISLRHEKSVADLVRNASNYASTNKITLSGTSQFDDLSGGTYPYVTSNPVAVIRAAMQAVYTATGQQRWPNTIALPTLGLPYIDNHPRIIDRFKNFTLTQPDAFRVLTGFEGNIILVDSVYNSANNLDATPAMTSFWGKDIWVGIVDPTPGQRTFTFGKTFAQLYPTGETRPTERWREEARKADLVRNNWKYDLKIVSAGAGYLITNAFGSSAF